MTNTTGSTYQVQVNAPGSAEWTRVWDSPTIDRGLNALEFFAGEYNRFHSLRTVRIPADEVVGSLTGRRPVSSDLDGC